MFLLQYFAWRGNPERVVQAMNPSLPSIALVMAQASCMWLSRRRQWSSRRKMWKKS